LPSGTIPTTLFHLDNGLVSRMANGNFPGKRVEVFQ
jgi:hypothetical protein